MLIEIRIVVFCTALFVASEGLAQQIGNDDGPGFSDQTVPVADEVPDALDDTLSLDARLLSEFERYKRLVDEGTLDEADISAKRIVELVIRLHGPDSLETSKALNNLALVQYRNGQYDAAIQNFESAVQIIESAEDRLNEKLVNPLKGLGAAQLSSGRPDLAKSSFSRAAHITQVNEGPHNIGQVEILESLAQSTLLVGDNKEARRILDRIHILNVRHFEGDPLALMPSLMRRASWQHAARHYNDERATYRRAIRIVESQLGKAHPQLILPLTKLGESYYFVDLSETNPQATPLVTSGELYFKRAARIAESAEDIGWRERADTKLALADHYIFVEEFNRARKIYRDVWDFLSADDERLAARAELLEQPVVLVEDSLPKYVANAPASETSGENLLTGTVRVDYTVSQRGRVRNIRTEANPAEFTDMQRMVHREIRTRIFRPQMTDAETQVSDSLVFTHRFFYRQADLDALRVPAEPAPAESPADSSST